MIIARFLIQEKLERVWFFEETLFVADISIETILKMLFLSLKNVNKGFTERNDFTWTNYTAIEVLLTIKKVELIDKKQIAKTTLDENTKIFLIHVTTLLPLSI